MRKAKPAEKRQGGPAMSCAEARSAIFCRCDSGVTPGLNAEQSHVQLAAPLPSPRERKRRRLGPYAFALGVGWEVMLQHFKRIPGLAAALVALSIPASAEGGPVDLQPPSFSNPTNIT